MEKKLLKRKKAKTSNAYKLNPQVDKATNGAALAFLLFLLAFLSSFSLPHAVFAQDNVQPSVFSVYPVTGTESDWMNLEAVRIQFSEPIDRNTTNSNTIKLYAVITNDEDISPNTDSFVQVNLTYSFNPSSSIVTLTPMGLMMNNNSNMTNISDAVQKYMVEITDRVRDLEGNNLDQDYSFTFAPSDTTTWSSQPPAEQAASTQTKPTNKYSDGYAYSNGYVDTMIKNNTDNSSSIRVTGSVVQSNNTTATVPINNNNPVIIEETVVPIPLTIDETEEVTANSSNSSAVGGFAGSTSNLGGGSSSIWWSIGAGALLILVFIAILYVLTLRSSDVVMDDNDYLDSEMSLTKSFGKSHSIKDMTIIPNEHKRKLDALGIKTSYQLWKESAYTIAKHTGASLGSVKSWQNAAELASVKNITPQAAELLERSGIHTIDQLTDAEPDKLVKVLQRQNSRLHMQENLPEQATVKQWIDSARDYKSSEAEA